MPGGVRTVRTGEKQSRNPGENGTVNPTMGLAISVPAMELLASAPQMREGVPNIGDRAGTLHTSRYSYPYNENALKQGWKPHT